MYALPKVVRSWKKFMRRVEYDRFGDASVLRLRDAPTPIPGDGELRVRVHAAALNPKDVLLRKGRMQWLAGRSFPRTTGYDFAGEVDAVGPEVTGYAVGDRVFGMLPGQAGGSIAEELVAPARCVARMPEGLTFEECAGVPLAALTALQALRDCGRVKHDDRVLINGASGGVGVFAIQVARTLGARVTTLSSARNLELCRSLGASEALDYAEARPFDPPPRWDCVFDVFGNRSFAAVRPALTPLGTYVTTVPSARNVVDHVRTAVGFPRARLVVVESNGEDLARLAHWLSQGIIKPVVDRVFALDEVADAQRYIETKRARGKVIVRVR